MLGCTVVSPCVLMKPGANAMNCSNYLYNPNFLVGILRSPTLCVDYGNICTSTHPGMNICVVKQTRMLHFAELVQNVLHFAE